VLADSHSTVQARCGLRLQEQRFAGRSRAIVGDATASEHLLAASKLLLLVVPMACGWHQAVVALCACGCALAGNQRMRQGARIQPPGTLSRLDAVAALAVHGALGPASRPAGSDACSVSLSTRRLPS